MAAADPYSAILFLNIINVLQRLSCAVALWFRSVSRWLAGVCPELTAPAVPSAADRSGLTCR